MEMQTTEWIYASGLTFSQCAHVSSWSNLSYFCCVHTHAHIILLGTIANHTSLLITENVFVYYCQYSVLCLHWELAKFLWA
jgi:hypothetical protein